MSKTRADVREGILDLISSVEKIGVRSLSTIRTPPINRTRGLVETAEI